jgi:hypothetical protein
VALSDTVRDIAVDGSLPDDWRTATFRVRVNETDRVNVGAVLADLSARDAGGGWWTFAVHHFDHPSPDFAAGMLHRLDRGGVGGEVVLDKVTSGTAEPRRVVGRLASGEVVYSP